MATTTLSISPKYGQLDCDSQMFLKHFDGKPGSTVLEVGANEEFSASILVDNDYLVTAIDLRPQEGAGSINPIRIQGDFVQLAPKLGLFDYAFSTSAIEHFGLNVYGGPVNKEYDIQAVEWMYKLLKPNGKCYLTVPFGKTYVDEGDWRVYTKYTLEDRLIRNFIVEKKIFFKSADCIGCPDVDGIVTQQDADNYEGRTHPHLTVFLQMRKPDGN